MNWELKYISTGTLAVIGSNLQDLSRLLKISEDLDVKDFAGDSRFSFVVVNVVFLYKLKLRCLKCVVFGLLDVMTNELW